MKLRRTFDFSDDETFPAASAFPKGDAYDYDSDLEVKPRVFHDKQYHDDSDLEEEPQVPKGKPQPEFGDNDIPQVKPTGRPIPVVIPKSEEIEAEPAVMDGGDNSGGVGNRQSRRAHVSFLEERLKMYRGVDETKENDRPAVVTPRAEDDYYDVEEVGPEDPRYEALWAEINKKDAAANKLKKAWTKSKVSATKRKAIAQIDKRVDAKKKLEKTVLDQQEAKEKKRREAGKTVKKAVMKGVDKIKKSRPTARVIPDEVELDAEDMEAVKALGSLKKKKTHKK